MQWFRSHRFLGAQAALFALLVQFTVAFGHVHIGNANEGAAVPAATADLDLVIHDASDTPVPADQGQDPADAWCAICATIHLTNTAQIAMPPALLLPVSYRAIEQSLLSEIALDDLRCFEQRSRGPPQA